jgi:hypothetical protein
MANNIAYYHMHLTDNPVIWTSVFFEQMNIIEESGLMGALEAIRVRCITQDDERNQMFKYLTETYRVPFHIEFVKNTFAYDAEAILARNSPHACSEDVTLKRVYDDAWKEDKNILYFHTKGTTSFFNHLNPPNIRRHKEYYYWRKFMNWGVLERWKDCIAALETHDTAGCNYYNEPLPHYSGNFWWTKSSHIRSLPDPHIKTWWNELKAKKPETQDMSMRMGDEMWLCSSLTGTKSYDIVDIPANIRPLHDCMTKETYEGFLRQ